MNTVDITKSTCHIKNILEVIKSKNTRCNKRLVQNCRHSDAFVYITSGACTYTFSDGSVQEAHAGDILYLAHNATYTMYIHDENYMFIFCDFLFDSDAQRECMIITAPNPAHAENLFLKLWNQYRIPRASSNAEMLSILYSIYAIIINARHADYIQPQQRNKIQELKEYIDLNYSDPNLSVSSLSEMAGMSEVYFRKLFGKKYGQTPSKYILSTRLRKARELMKYQFITLADIAEQCGFSSQQYFCRIFKENLGITPTEYSKKLK
jgi:AraC-like DNA-binding protein